MRIDRRDYKYNTCPDRACVFPSVATPLLLPPLTLHSGVGLPLSCTPSPTMENSHLPIEVCELIINECLNFIWTDCNKTLRACALTCSAWLPRSQFNLYREVHLWYSESVAQITDTFIARPELAGYVRAFDISLFGSYAPLAQVLSLPMLRKCQRLELNIDWTCFPPKYVQNCLVPSLTNFTSVVELKFRNRSAASARDFFHVIWAMPQLQSCTYSHGRQITPIAALSANLEKTALKMQYRFCLQKLELWVSLQHLSISVCL